jgi:hypothetical protein
MYYRTLDGYKSRPLFVLGGLLDTWRVQPGDVFGVSGAVRILCVKSPSDAQEIAF